MPLERETVDAEKVDKAMEALTRGKVEAARRILMEVVANTPEGYQKEFEQDGTLHRKFWDMTDFMDFVTRDKELGNERNIVWIGNAYPRAFYHLGFICAQEGNLAEAIQFLDRGRALEPDEPHFDLEKGHVF